VFHTYFPYRTKQEVHGAYTQHIAHLLSITLPCITVLQPGEHGWNMVFFSSSSGCGPNAVKGAEAPPERGMLLGVAPINCLDS